MLVTAWAAAISALALLPLPASARPLTPATPAAPAAFAGQVVGKFELGAPSVTSFVLHGTLPVLPYTYPRPDGKQPFGVIDSNGVTVPAQCELVARYPEDSWGAAVVEVLAKVQRPAGAQPGQRITYSIVQFVHAAPIMAPTPAVAAVLNTPGAVTLRSKDVFAHEYRADLLRGAQGEQVLRSGEAALQTRYYETMRPTAGPIGAPNGALPHFLNVHSYVTEWAGEDMLSLDLRVHNGPSGENSASVLDDPVDSVYFKNLELWIPTGWRMVFDWDDPAIGPMRQEPGFTVVPLIDATPDGNLHVLPPQAQFERRIVLVKQGLEARATSLASEEWIGFCRRGVNPLGMELWSWWNEYTANYFPQRHRLPELDYLNPVTERARMASNLQPVSDALTQGIGNSGPISAPVLGWAHPWGVKYGGMTSGTEIYLYDGLVTADCASTEGYRLSQLSLRMYGERNPVALYNQDGNPTKFTDWITHGPQFDYIYMQFYLRLLPGPDPFGMTTAPTFQVDYVNSHGLEPAYETELVSYKPIDIQHQIRVTRSMKVLTWLGNDALAKDDLRMQAEIARLSYNDLPNSPAGNGIGTGMLVDLQFVAANPGVGLDFGRGEGWTVDSMAAAYAINGIPWRQQALGWFDEVYGLVRDGQANCSGILQRNFSSKLLDGLFFGRQSIEQAIIENALWGMKKSVYTGRDPVTAYGLRSVIAKSAYSMVTFPAWDDVKHGPWGQLAVAPLQTNLPPFCNVLPPLGTATGVDKYQVWSSFAYGYELTLDPIFLDKALMMAQGSNLLSSLQAGGFSNLENRAALIALMQQP
ncbi:MAG TPA: hypothetical protein VM509_09850 [Planctomycetota bacterium]|nr:hypothetical protein [Planctomycetota bacterium]